MDLALESDARAPNKSIQEGLKHGWSLGTCAGLVVQ